MRPTVMKISTDAIAANARAIRAHVAPGVRMMCVIKADAYGHDSVRTAGKLLGAGADAFAVAIVEEAEALRRAGIGQMILVLGGAGRIPCARRCAPGSPRRSTVPKCWTYSRTRPHGPACGQRPI